MSDHLEGRMAELERWVRDHEVKCTERYTKIIEQNKTVITDFASMRNWLHRRMDWLLAVLGLLALSRVFTPEQIASFVKTFLN